MSIVWERYNMLTIVWEKRVQSSWWSLLYAVCKCDCGNTKDILYYSVKTWRTRSCWCLHSEWYSMDASREKIWEKIHMLTIVDVWHREAEVYWKIKKIKTVTCQCDCWEIKVFDYGNIMREWHPIKSCWCFKESRKTWWFRGKRPYRIWLNMRNWCNNPQHESYNRRWAKWITYPKERDTFMGRWNEWKSEYSDDKYFIRVNPFTNYSRENCKREIAYNVSQMDLFDNDSYEWKSAT